METKTIIYQIFTRLFGNSNNNCIPNGSKEQNGCGLFNDITTKALSEIKKLGATHVWFTGIIAHATQTNYTHYGLHSDHPAIVKGKAGSPYAIKDYYDVDPDLASNPEQRMNEFQQLILRTHNAGLKAIIDFVPNHVARQYKSTRKPQGTKDLGEEDDKNKSFDPQNNFYYLPHQQFNPAFDLKASAATPYTEYPAKATGNDCFSPRPGKNDWYETIKLNYGIDYCAGHTCHFTPTPSTWIKMRDILLFWAEKDIDGFRCDMAEMVPVEFWSWVIPQIKQHHPDLIFIAEVYNPNEYRNYIRNGHFDYLYDKVGLYDTLRNVVCGYTPAHNITHCWQSTDDIKTHMLNFLENHDEQRIASQYFAGNAAKARPALIVSICMGNNPFMIYFGQELGEHGMDEEGYSGRDGRTTIFDYWSVNTIRRWNNNGHFDQTLLTPDEQALRTFYSTILNLCHTEDALYNGEFYDLTYANLNSPTFNSDRCFAFVRRKAANLILILTNFSEQNMRAGVQIPQHLFEFMQIQEINTIEATNLIDNTKETITFNTHNKTTTTIPAFSGKLLKINVRPAQIPNTQAINN